uniref:TNase-like domain-containing protein n=1 Tax=viral metagenome TaxID=1070528 RepID=A0A6C0EUE9_9ZZZZ
MSANKRTNYICNLWKCISNLIVRSNNTNHYSDNTNTQSNTQTNTQTDNHSIPQPTQLTIPLPTIEWKDTQAFIPPICEGQVIKVYDGDTITIAAKLPYNDSLLYRFSIRLNGIDSPEIKGHSEDEKTAAQVSKRALENLILHKYVVLKNKSTEKYGRILADVYIVYEKNDKLHLNKWMLDNRYAVEYDGGTKKAPKSWLKYQKTGSKN